MAKFFKVGAVALLAGPLRNCRVSRCYDCGRFMCKGNVPLVLRNNPRVFIMDIRCFCENERNLDKEEKMVKVLQFLLKSSLDQALQTYKDTVSPAQKEAATKRAALHRTKLRRLLYKQHVDARPSFKMVGDEPKRLTEEGFWDLIEGFDDNALTGTNTTIKQQQQQQQ